MNALPSKRLARRAVGAFLVMGTLAWAAGPARLGAEAQVSSSGNAPSGVTTAGTAASAFTYGTPVQLPNDSQHEELDGVGEPVIKYDSTGTIFIQGTCCVGLSPETWYSRDGGKTFKFMPGAPRTYTLGSEGDFAVDDVDRPMFADTAIPYMTVTRWSPHGTSWERTVPATEVTAPLQDRPWLTYSRGALYMFANSGLETTYLYRSMDEGLTFNPVSYASFNGNFPTAIAGNRDDGAIWVQGATGSSLPDDVVLPNGTVNHTSSITSPERGSLSGNFPAAVATDDAGNGYVVWSTEDQSGCDVYLDTSTNFGKTWATPVKVNTTTGCATFPAVAAGDAGHVVISWYQNAAENAQGSVPTTAPWHLMTAISVNALTAHPSFIAEQLPNVTVYTGPLNRNLWDFFEVAIGPDGHFGIAYVVGVPAAGTDCSGEYTGVCKHVWFVREASGPLLQANRLAASTAATISSVSASSGKLSVTGGSTFKRAAVDRLFPLASSAPGGQVVPVGPDSKVLEFDVLTGTNGLPAYDGLPGNNFTWQFTVNGKAHTVKVDSRDRNGPTYKVDGKSVDGTVDGYDGIAVVRVPEALIGATPGAQIKFSAPSSGLGQQNGSATYTVPGPAVTLKLLQGTGTVATGTGALSIDTTSYSGALNVSGLSGTYTLAVTACYAGSCQTTSRSVTI